MAYVVPSGVIQLFRGINLDNRYMHTIYFASEAAQNTWFTSKVAYTYSAQMYTRHNGNTIKLKVPNDTVADCTYLRFQNRPNGMWYYAFINATNYINENVTEIIFEIDVMQTWFIQKGSILPCRVLREHVNDDTFGNNLEAEPVGSDVYDYDPIPIDDNLFGNYSVIISSTAQPTNEFDYGLYCGTKLEAYDCDDSADAADITQAMYAMLGSWDKNEQTADIVDLYTFPTDLIQTYPFHQVLIDVEHPSVFEEYTPKNNKLYSYPYAFLYATTGNGDSEQYRWEYWDGDNVGRDVQFGVLASPLGGGSVQCYPRVYNGVQEFYDMGLVIDNFPKNSANIGAYQAWVAAGGQTRLKNAEEITRQRNTAEMITTGANFVAQTVTGAAQIAKGSALSATGAGALKGVPMIAQGAAQIANASAGLITTEANIKEANNKIAYQWNDIAYAPNIVKGKNTPSIGCSYRTLNFYFFHGHVRADEAKRIDDFFTCYGYRVNKVKTPNLTGRQYWNFVQTENAEISGNMPASSKEAIARIFDGGITFWHNGDNVGNYGISITHGSANNPIV